MAKNRTSKNRKNNWHIWIGFFSDSAPDDYFGDDSTNRGEDDPLNKFAAEQGQHTFDYDFTEISFVEARKAKSPREFVDGHSYSESYLEEVVNLADKLDIKKINVFVIAREREFSSPRSVKGRGYTLAYLGLFACGE